MKLQQLLLGIGASLISVLPVQASDSSMIKLTYTNSQYQCSADSPLVDIRADVYYDDTLVTEGLAVGEEVLVSDLDKLSMDYYAVGGGCGFASPTELNLTKDDPLPSIPGAYKQESITALLEGLNDYESLYLVELGTTDSSSFAYDLQDIVITVNHNPDLSDPDSTLDNSDPIDPIVFAD